MTGKHDELVARLEAAARHACYWSEPSTCHDAYCIGRCMAVTPEARFFRPASAPKEQANDRR